MPQVAIQLEYLFYSQFWKFTNSVSKLVTTPECKNDRFNVDIETCAGTPMWLNWHIFAVEASKRLFLLPLHLPRWYSLRWRHNDNDGVSNHQPHDCLLNRLFRHRSKKTSKLRVTGLCAGNSPGPVNSPHKGPVTRKMFPFDDVIMSWNVEVIAPCNL